MPSTLEQPDSQAEVTSADILTAARDAGHEIGPPDLKSLRRAGLLHPSRQAHILGVAGSQTLYPAAARDQLLLVLRLREHERRFDPLRVQVWWNGGWVDPQLLRTSIARRLDHAGVRDVRLLLERYPDPIDAADYLLERLGASRSRSPVVRLLQRNLRDREERWRVAAHLMLQIMLGGEPIWREVDVDRDEPMPAEQLRIAGGFEHARTATVTIDGTTLGPLLRAQTPIDSLVERFTRGGLFPVTAWPDIVNEATDHELDQARDDTRALIEPLVIFVQALEALAARGGLGLGLLTRLERATSDDFPILWVPYWIVWRRTSAPWERRNLRYLTRALALGGPAARAIADRAQTARDSA